MKNDVFLKMDTEYARRSSESEQEYMERILRAAMEYDESLHTFNEIVGPQFVSCDAKERSAVFAFSPEKWMGNQDSILHGGITSTLHDICMGQLAKFYLENKTTTVTVQLNVEFIRPVPLDVPLRIHAYCVKYGRKVLFARGDLVNASDGTVLSEATAVYM